MQKHIKRTEIWVDFVGKLKMVARDTLHGYDQWQAILFAHVFSNFMVIVTKISQT